jgi:hypothetical protein
VDLLLTESPVEDDPLWGIVGLGNSGVHDLALEHDRYMAEIEETDNSQYGR